MRPSSMRSSTRSISQAQPTGLSSSSDSHTIPNSRSAPRSQALLDHAPVAVLEDVQRHALGRAARRSRAGTAGSPCAAGSGMRVSLGRVRRGAARRCGLGAACARRSSGCRRSPAAAATRAAAGRAPAAAGSRGRRTGATPTARRRGRRSPRACGWSSRTSSRAAPRRVTRTSSKPAPRAARAQLAGREGVHVDDALQRRVRRRRRSARRRRPRADRPAPQRRDGAGDALGHAREAVAVARGLAGEQHACRRARARARTRRTRARGRGCGAAPRGRARGRSSRPRTAAARRRRAAVVTSRPSRCALALQRREHARRDVGARRLADQPGAQQVQREVAGAGADLQRAREARRARAPSALRTFASTCSRPTSPKSMPHLAS